jgi:hypothetical protein
MRGTSYLGGSIKRDSIISNPYVGTRQDGLRNHDQSWSDLHTLSDEIGSEFRAVGGILNAALWGALVWLALACFVVILWGVMA